MQCKKEKKLIVVKIGLIFLNVIYLQDVNSYLCSFDFGTKYDPDMCLHESPSKRQTGFNPIDITDTHKKKKKLASATKRGRTVCS